MIFQNILKFILNPYLLISYLFITWIVFFDSESFISQYKLIKKLISLENEKLYYIKNIEEVKKEREELLNNNTLLEKFAREKYYMKKEKEDVYVFVT